MRDILDAGVNLCGTALFMLGFYAFCIDSYEQAVCALLMAIYLKVPTRTT